MLDRVSGDKSDAVAGKARQVNRADTATRESDASIRQRLFSQTILDYFALMKPRVMSLVVFTAFVGLVAAPGTIHPVLGLSALLLIAVGAGASGALNMWYDADIDAIMQRTAKRPIPRGRLGRKEALVFGAVLSIGSVLGLGVLVNWVAASLLALTIGYYVFIYTMWLKRRTPHNIVIGGAAGAFAPMVGWAAVTGSVSIDSIILFLIIFMWTPPHFWALALYRMGDYERAGVPMLPNVAGADETRRQIWLYSLILVITALMPSVTGLGGVTYTLSALVLNALFLHRAWLVYTVREDEAANQMARKLFTFSIFYLFALFTILLLDHAVSIMLT